MADPILLSLTQSECDEVYVAAGRGDPAALEFWTSLWADSPRPLFCFLCDGEIAYPPHPLILPDYDHPARRLIAPLCETCRDRTTMQKYNRGLRLLKSMCRAKTGKKNLQFVFAGHRR
jgi:hypothetical protein